MGTGEDMSIEQLPLTPELVHLAGEYSVAAGKKESGESAYYQALGGSLNIAVVNYLYAMSQNPDVPLPDFMASVNSTLDSIKKTGEVEAFCVDGRFGPVNAKGTNLGVHRDSHAAGEVSGCGFADRLFDILGRFGKDEENFAVYINQFAPGLINDENRELWRAIAVAAAKVARAAEENPASFPRGEALISAIESRGDVSVQTVQGDHKEKAARFGTGDGTFDTEKAVADGNDMFNLDLPPVLEQARTLNVDEAFAKLATAGLYAATEAVLVEDKKGQRLPLIVV